MTTALRNDEQKRRALRSMKNIATGMLLAIGIVFCFSFALQEQYPWLAYVRAAAEGGMVGAIADWFAVTALFRHPLGIPIPHTAIIPHRKNEIGASLGAFVSENFLRAELIEARLARIGIGEKLGEWLAKPANAQRLGDEAAVAATGVLTMLADDDVRDVIEQLARTHLVEPEWSAQLGRWGETLVENGGHHGAVDLLIDKSAGWLQSNPDAFARVVSSRLPGWVPSFVDRMVDGRLHREALGFLEAMKADQHHPARVAIDRYLLELGDKLQRDPATMAGFERAKEDLFDSPRVRGLASSAWNTTKKALIASLADPGSGLRTQLVRAIVEIGQRLGTDGRFAAKIDTWVTAIAVYLVDNYADEIANLITDTVERWDPKETTEKIELQVGRDLQYIRINGTVVGALAGLVIFTVANAVFGT